MLSMNMRYPSRTNLCWEEVLEAPWLSEVAGASTRMTQEAEMRTPSQIMVSEEEWSIALEVVAVILTTVARVAQ